jgi:3',5'-cyclic AMP phosphodiesterase CpdA
MLQGIDLYSQAFAKDQLVAEPGGGDLGMSDDDPQLLAYLSMLNHQAVHAKIRGDTNWQDQINKQRSRFKFGNPLWEQQWIQYYWYYWDYPFHKGQSPQYRSWQDKRFGNMNPEYGEIKWKIPSDATIALIGDIGTGTDIAATVLESALSFNPDVILHVGDIYYSGTPFEFEHRFIALYKDALKVHGKNVPMYTIPGNHEYFTGAHGFFNCLDSNQLIVEDNQCQAASFFSIKSEDGQWQFLAMDTGYYGHFMDVSPTIQQAALKLLHHNHVDVPQDPSNPNWFEHFNPHFKNCPLPNNPIHDPTAAPPMITVRSDELAWHKKQLNKFNGRTILLSHHQLYSATQNVGQPPTSIHEEDRSYVNTDLWIQFSDYFNHQVAAWFWGHEHNLGIYANNYRPGDWNSVAKATFKTLKKGRCIGHAAIPVQESEDPYKNTFPVPLISDDVELDLTDGWYNRGYQILQLQGKGQPLKASYYQLKEADPTPLKIFEEEIE